MRRHSRRRLVVLLLFLSVALVWTSTASAYRITYYFGTPSNPVRISNGTAGSQTSGTAFRLFNEAYARQSGCGGHPCGGMAYVSLYYNPTHIGTGSNTFYFRVYRNGENVRAGCQVTSNAGWFGGYPTYSWCDTTY
jgi:hypothetical protein